MKAKIIFIGGADGSGVVFVLARIAPDVLERADTIVNREKDMIAMGYKNRTASEIMDSSLENMLERVE